jgi:hypothetical protein
MKSPWVFVAKSHRTRTLNHFFSDHLATVRGLNQISGMIEDRRFAAKSDRYEGHDSFAVDLIRRGQINVSVSGSNKQALAMSTANFTRSPTA